MSLAVVTVISQVTLKEYNIVRKFLVPLFFTLFSKKSFFVITFEVLSQAQIGEIMNIEAYFRAYSSAKIEIEKATSEHGYMEAVPYMLIVKQELDYFDSQQIELNLLERDIKQISDNIFAKFSREETNYSTLSQESLKAYNYIHYLCEILKDCHKILEEHKYKSC